MRTAKIYKVCSDIDHRIYVGQTWQTLADRFDGHCSQGAQTNMYLARAIKKYGRSRFSIHLLEELPANTPQPIIDEAEIHWGLKLKALAPIGYSLRLGRGRSVCSEETKRKLSESQKGKFVSLETRHKQSLAHFGKIHSADQNKRQAAALKGIRPSLKAQLAQAKACAKDYQLLSPEGIITNIHNMSQFCKIHGLSFSTMSLLNKGIVHNHKGWRRTETEISENNS